MHIGIVFSAPLRLCGLCVCFILLLLTSPVPAQMPAPEQAIVIDLHRPWLDGANWDNNTPPVVYGVDATRDQPRFSIVDPNAKSLWVYRFALPVDVAKYPILTMKYRTTGAGKNMDHVLRLVADKDGARSRIDVWQGSDLVRDGQEHELRQDLRELNADGSLTTFGIALATENQPATLDLTELKFSADAAIEKLKEDAPLRIRVTDGEDKPLSGAKVTVDAERANFARSAQTDLGGEVSITPLVNEQQKHMVRVEKDGYLTLEIPNAVNESGQGIVIKTMKAVPYGGTAEDSDGRVAASAQISIKLKPELLSEIPTRFQTNIVTGNSGEWRSLPLPADASQLIATLTQLDSAGKPKVTELDASKFKVNVRERNARDLRDIGFAIARNAHNKRTVGASQPAVSDGALPVPEQAVVLDLHHPWIDATKFERNPQPNVYGIDLTSAAPRISLLDQNAKTMWACRLFVPIDAKKYPIVSFRYRAQNPGAKGTYVLRLVHGGQTRSAIKFFTPADLKADGQVHELTADLREKQIDDTISEAGVALWSDEKPAWIDVVGISFSAAPQVQNPKIGDDPAVRFTVTDVDGSPIAGAHVIVDAERANFAHSGDTDDKGEVSITPLATESHAHMARVQKTGYMSIDHAVDGNVAVFKTTAAVQYGGVAQGDSGQISPNAQLTIRVKNQFIRDTGLMNYPLAIVTTDDKGKWQAPPMPKDASLLTIQRKEAPTNGGEATVSSLDAEKFQMPDKPWPVFAAAEATALSTESRSVPNAPATQPSAAKPTVEPITALVQKVDDTTAGISWTGIEGDNLVAIVHPQPGMDQTVKIPFMDITEMTVRRGASFNAPTTTPATRPANTLPSSRLTLAGDDRLFGTVTGWSEKKLSMRPNVAPLTTFELPVSSVRELWCGTQGDIKKAQALKEQPGLDDIAFAKKDDDVIAVHGIVIGIDDDALHFRFDNADRKIGLNRLVGIVMAKAEEAPADDVLYEQVQLVNDDQISGKLTALEPKQLVMQTRGGTTARIPIDQIAKITTRNGRLVFLSDLKPAKVQQTPYFDRLLEYRVDKSLNGRPIVLLDGTYAHGISVHSRCILMYNLNGRFNEFRTKVGFQLPEGKIGECAIRVLGDGKPLFNNPEARGDQPPADLKLKVDGVRELMLVVDYGKNDDVGDRVVWANARLLRAGK